MLNSKSQARTNAQESTNDEATTSSSHNAKPYVIGSQSQADIEYIKKIEVYVKEHSHSQPKEFTKYQPRP